MSACIVHAQRPPENRLPEYAGSLVSAGFGSTMGISSCEESNFPEKTHAKWEMHPTVFERKMQERQEFLDRYFVFEGSDYQPPRDWSHSHGLLDEIRQAYKDVAERRALNDATQPRELKQHNPSEAVEMPTNVYTEGSAAGHLQSGRRGADRPRDRTDPADVAPPLSVTPPPRQVDQPDR